MCSSCSKKENLKLPIPNYIDKVIMDEYVSKREHNAVSIPEIYDYFCKLFPMYHFVYNPKQIRRSIINMDALYFYYKNGIEGQPPRKFIVDGKYTYEEDQDGNWNLIEQVGFLKKSMKKHYSVDDFEKFLKTTTSLEII